MGLTGAVLLGCTGEDGAPATATYTPGSTLRVRSILSPGDAPPEQSVLRLGMTEADLGVDGLSPFTRLLTYSRLVGFDPRSAGIFGGVASDIEVPEPLTVRFRVPERQYFHPDGRGIANPLTAFDVVREFERRRDEEVFLFTDVIERSEAVDETTLLVQLRAPFSFLFEFLAKESASIRDDGEYGAVSAALGSGAFYPSAMDGEELVFLPSPLLEGPARPRLSELRVRVAGTQGELDAAFTHGDLDVRHHADAASRQVARLIEDRVEVERTRHRMRGLAVSLLAPRDPASVPTIEAFRDTRVRQALSIALDRRMLASLDGSRLTGPVGPAFGGDALPEVELESHLLYQHDPEGAKAMLAVVDREALPVRIDHSDAQAMTAMAHLVAAQLNAAGFVARLVPRALPDFQMAFLSGDFEVALFELDRLSSPDIGLRLHTTTGLEGRSPWGYSNPVYDAAVRETLSEIDPVLRTRRSREAQRMLLDAVPAMFPLNAPVEYASLLPGVRGYEFDGYDFNAAVLASQWQGQSGEG